MDENGKPDEACVAALLFDAGFDGHRIDPASLNGDRLHDDQLLWIDLQGEVGLPAVLERNGVDLSLLRAAPAHSEGMVRAGDWTYLYAAALRGDSGRRTNAEQLVVAIGDRENIVVTAHARPIGFLQALVENEAEHLRAGLLHPASFAASLLDRMLTDYLDVRDAFETAVDRIELQVLRRPKPAHLSELQQLRRHASRLRRHLATQRDMFDGLARPDFSSDLPREVGRHWQLLASRYARTMAAAESARELVNGSFDVYTSRVAEGTNETMRVLTVVTVVLGTLSVVAGMLGMNFQAELFESGDGGFWWTVVVMAGVGLAGISAGLGWSVWRRRG